MPLRVTLLRLPARVAEAPALRSRPLSGGDDRVISPDADTGAAPGPVSLRRGGVAAGRPGVDRHPVGRAMLGAP